MTTVAIPAEAPENTGTKAIRVPVMSQIIERLDRGDISDMPTRSA
jgi:hypothetical protein